MRTQKRAGKGCLVRLLLDTQILVWLVTGDKRLRRVWIDLIGNTVTELNVSAVVAFEYADLQSRKRIPLDEPITELVERFDLRLLAFPAGAWRWIERLGDIRRDPIDRMLVAHALEDDFMLMTADESLRRYPANFV